MNPFKHQLEGVQKVLDNNGRGALFWEMGLGKTLGALYFMKRIREKVPDCRMLVIAPLSLLEGAWGEDIKKFTSRRYHNMHKNGCPDLDDIPDIVVTNYESLLSEKTRDWIWMLTRKAPNWICTLDESSRIKNHESKTTKNLLKMRDLFRFRLIMSGTPAPNSETEYWPQIQFIEEGILPDSFYAFRNSFFFLKNRYTGQEMPQGAYMTRQQAQEIFKKFDYAMTEADRLRLMADIMRWAHIAKKRDCMDLPPTVDEIRKVQLGKDQRRAYEEMKQHLVLELQNETIAAPVALTKVMKLRQITSGFVYNAMGEALEIQPDKQMTPSGVVFHGSASEYENPKLKELLQVIEDAGDQPMIIWIQFHWEMIKICHELHKRWPDKVVTLASTTKDRDESIQAFKSGKARFLVAHPRSAAHGLTFVNCALQVFFCLDYSWEAYIQAKGRTDRFGQTRSTTYVHLIAEGTIDEDVLSVLNRKGDAQEIVYKLLAKKK